MWKANTSYQFTPGILAYFTYSTGYRLGGPNTGAEPCQLPLDTTKQNICALPDELFFGPDKTTNYELGVRSELFDKRLSMTLSLFRIDWDGIQLASQTVNGAIGITRNGGTAKNQGFDFTFNARVTDRLTIRGNYSYVDAKLTSDVPDLLQTRNPDDTARPKVFKESVLSGDRLPGSAKYSGAIGATYTMPVGDHELVANWTATYTGSILTRPGARGAGEYLPAYVLHRASLTYRLEKWDLTLFANNIFDKYAITGVSNDLSRFGFVNSGVISRFYARSIATPRVLGAEATLRF